MAALRLKFLYLIITTLITAMVFTCVYAQDQTDAPPSQPSGLSIEGGSGSTDSPGGMPEGGMPGMPGGMPQEGMPGMPEGGMMAGGPPGGDFTRYNAGEPYPEKYESEITSAIYIKDGKYLMEKSAKAAVSGGKVGDTSASEVKITSKDDNFNGIFVNGKSEYTLSDATIDIYGNGSNDNYGLGAGALVGGGATLILKNVKITTNGSRSPATSSAASGTLKVYNSILTSKSGGTAGRGSRATNTTTNSKSYFYDSIIIAESWGALSTDSAEPNVYLEANNCDIKTIKGGYGNYADNNCKVVINGSRYNTAGYAAVISGTGQFYSTNTDATTGSGYVEVHAPGPTYNSIGILEIKGGKLSTETAVIRIKSANIDITIDGTEMTSKNGILIQSVVNDDRNTAKVTGPVTGVRATLKNMNLEGNIIREDTDREMSIDLNGTLLKGSIKDASISLDSSSKWTATADSKVTLVGSADVKTIDALNGVTITAVAGKGCKLKGSHKLPGGGTLDVKAD